MRLRLFLLFALLSFITRWLSLTIDILDVDEAAHIVGSWEFLRGKLLYTDFVNNKPPLLYVYYSLAQFVFGRGMFAVHLFTVLFTVPLTAMALASFFRYRREGVVAGILFLVYSASFYAHDMLSSNTELLMILPASWAVTRFQAPDDFGSPKKIVSAGVLIGVALLFKYPVILWLIPITITLIYYGIKTGAKSRLWGLSGLFLFCFAIPPALTYAYFAFLGGEQELIYWLFKNNLAYTSNPITLQEASGRAASYLIPFLIVTSPLWWLSFRKSAAIEGPRRVLLLGLILFTIPAAFWGFRFYPHYFIPFYVPLCLAASPAVTALNPVKRKWFVSYTLFIFLGFTAANCYLYFSKEATVYQERDPAFRATAERLKQDACYSHATLFAWGYAPIVYYYAELPAASRFVVLPQSGLTSYISGNLETVRGTIRSTKKVRQEHWTWLFEDLEKNQATYILDFSPTGIFRWDRYPMSEYPQLQQYVDANFERIDSIEGVSIYRRKNCDTNMAD